MLTLAVDTSGKSLSVALCRDEELVGEMSLRQGYNHSVTQMPLLQLLLDQCKIDLDAVDLFACTVGPGSFTGIRIGISSVKAMAYAKNKPALGVSSLKALAFPHLAVDGMCVCPLIDARRGRLYATAYEVIGHPNHKENPVNVLLAENNWLAEDFSHELLRVIGQNPVIFAGDGQNVLRGLLPSGFSNCYWTDEHGSSIHAADVARLAWRDWQAGVTGLPQSLTPDYRSVSQAERMRGNGQQVR